MKKIILTAVVFILSSISFFAVAGDDVDPRRARLLSSNGGVSAPPENNGTCSMAIVLAYQNGNIEEEDLPAECGGIADFNENGNGGTEIYGDANSGYMRDGEYVEEWGIGYAPGTTPYNWFQFKYGPYDEILTAQGTAVYPGERAVVTSCGLQSGAACFSFHSGPDRGNIRWKITARKSSEDTSTSDFINGTVTYFISFNAPSTSRQCVSSSLVAGRPTHGSCVATIGNPLGYGVPSFVAGYYVDVATSVPGIFRARFEKYNFSGNLKAPGTFVDGNATGVTCPNWEEGDFSGCSVSTSSPCSTSEMYQNGICFDPGSISI